MKRWIAVAVLAVVAFGDAQAATVPGARRVVTLAPHLVELVCAAGGCDRLVAITAHSNFPPEVTRLPQVGDAWSLNLEAILKQRPDLILAWDGGNSREAVERLQRLGLHVEWLKVGSLDEVAVALEKVGGWLGTKASAELAAQTYRTQLAALREQHRSDPPIKVVYQIETAPAYTINRDSPISEAMAVCGGVNVFGALPTLSAAISAEAMLAAAPDVVLYGGEENGDAIRAYWARLPNTSVAKAGTLYAVNSDLLARATPRVLEGIAEVCGHFDQARASLKKLSLTR